MDVAPNGFNLFFVMKLTVSGTEGDEKYLTQLQMCQIWSCHIPHFPTGETKEWRERLVSVSQGTSIARRGVWTLSEHYYIYSNMKTL